MAIKSTAQAAPDRHAHVVAPYTDGSPADPTAHRPYVVVAQGVDLLVVNVLGRLDWEVHQALDTLQREALAERDALRGRRRQAVLVETPWRLLDQPLLICPHGGGNAQWRWLLTCPFASFDLGLGELNGICCRVRLASELLWRVGYREAWRQVRATVDGWGDPQAQPLRYQVSELHLCADVAGLGVDTLRREAFVHRGAITSWHISDAQLLDLVPPTEGTAKAGDAGAAVPLPAPPLVTVQVRHGETETITFSQTAPHSCAIYNKPREIRLKNRDKVWMADIWRAPGKQGADEEKGRWDGVAPIARVEMRYEREALHEFQLPQPGPDGAQRRDADGSLLLARCDDVEVTFAALDGLWAYSTGRWLRHTTPNPADRRRSRWESSLWWRAVQGAHFGSQHITAALRKKAHAYQEERLVVTLLGYLESLCAYRAGRRPKAAYSLERTARAVVAEARRVYAERHTDFTREVRKKRKRLGYAD